MQMAWSANRTWRLFWSASEYTTTVLMPSSLHAQMTRRAISPRFAINTFLNIRPKSALLRPHGSERLSVLDRLTVLRQDPDDLASHLGLDLIHHLHGFDDAQGLPGLDPGPHLDEGGGVGVASPVEG